jgi:hypothetical protein
VNITYHLTGGRHATLEHADHHTLGVAVQHVVDKPSGTTTISGRWAGSSAPATFDNSDVVRIVIDVEA